MLPGFRPSQALRLLEVTVQPKVPLQSVSSFIIFAKSQLKELVSLKGMTSNCDAM